MAGDADAAARSLDEQLAAAVAQARTAVSAAEAPEKTDEQIVEAVASPAAEASQPPKWKQASRGGLRSCAGVRALARRPITGD